MNRLAAADGHHGWRLPWRCLARRRRSRRGGVGGDRPGVVGAILWLNLVLLPRLARRLHVPGLVLELILLPLVAGPGWLIGGPTGAGLGGLAWLAGIGLPRLVGRRLRARMRSAASRPGTIIVVDRQLE